MRLWPEVSRRSRFQVVLGTKGSSNYHNTLLHLFSCHMFLFLQPLEGKVSGFLSSEGALSDDTIPWIFFFYLFSCILCIIVLSLSFGVLYVWL